MIIKRSFVEILTHRLKESPHFIQVILGPRQVGKTSGVLQVLKNFKKSQYEYCLVEEGQYDSNWFLNQFQKTLDAKKKILVFDEIQKLENWSELVKLAWDRLKVKKNKIHLVLLGSSSLKLTTGLSESLTGRFEVIPCYHWQFSESRKAYKLKFEDYFYFGGYPGSYVLLGDQSRYKKYILHSIFETVVLQDILRFAQVKKPALFRQTFLMITQFPAQVVSYNKLLGQLQDLGNVDQVKYYLDLFAQAYLIKLLQKWSLSPISRASSPKIIIGANAFCSILNENLIQREDFQGHLFENIVGKRLTEIFDEVFYWSEGNFELDFVVTIKGKIYGIEVKYKNRKPKSLQEFRKKFPEAYTCIINLENYNDFEKNPEVFLIESSI